MKKIFIWLSLVVAVMAVCPVYAAQAPSDIAGHWAEQKIKLAISMGLFDNQPHLLDKFEPDRAVTRAEFCSTLNQLNKFTKEADVTFKDVKDTDWFAADIRRAVAAGYLQGDGSGYAKPDGLLTRAEAAVMLNGIMKYKDAAGESKKFKDYKKIPSWAVSSVDACVKQNIIKGDDKGNFRPNDSLTRAEIVMLISNVTGL